MKPDWKDAPEWANYLAKDANGVWFWYATRPLIEGSDSVWSYGGTYKRACVPDGSWKDSLERRP